PAASASLTSTLRAVRAQLLRPKPNPRFSRRPNLKPIRARSPEPETAPRPHTPAPSRKPSPRAPIPRHEPRLSAPRAASICAASRADPQPSSQAGPYSSSRAAKPIWLFPSNFWGVLDQVTAAAWDFFARTSLLGKHTCLAVRTRRVNLQPIRVVPAWVSFEITTYLRLCDPTRRQSSMDIDMTRVTRRGPRIPIVLGVPPRHRRSDFRSYGSACCTCSGTCQRLGTRPRQGQRQAGEQPEVTVASHRDFCFRLYLFLTLVPE
uniref:Uncharacterized protein n=1 Tax=Cucumis melo TaxID=3656 RepID=A0A9I9E6R5_CUCME